MSNFVNSSSTLVKVISISCTCLISESCMFYYYPVSIFRCSCWYTSTAGLWLRGGSATPGLGGSGLAPGTSSTSATPEQRSCGDTATLRLQRRSAAVDRTNQRRRRLASKLIASAPHRRRSASVALPRAWQFGRAFMPARGRLCLPRLFCTSDRTSFRGR